jgi:hypothetical protein
VTPSTPVEFHELRFDTQVIIEPGVITAHLARFGLLGFGATVEEALIDLVNEIDVYADRFLGDLTLYKRTKRVDHQPELLRFKNTAPEDRVALLLADSRSLALAG